MLSNQHLKEYTFSLSEPPYIVGHDSFFELCNQAMSYSFPSYLKIIINLSVEEYIELVWLNSASAYHMIIGNTYA